MLALSRAVLLRERRIFEVTEKRGDVVFPFLIEKIPEVSVARHISICTRTIETNDLRVFLIRGDEIELRSMPQGRSLLIYASNSSR